MCLNCDALRKENQRLKRQLGKESQRNAAQVLAREFGLTATETTILMTLFETRRAVSRDEICSTCSVASPNAVSIHAIHIRAKLPEGFLDETAKGVRMGYRLTAKGRAYIQEILAKERISMNALMDTDATEAPLGLAILAGRLAHELGAAAAIATLGRISQQLEAHRGSR